jgi:hypothetical protein
MEPPVKPVYFPHTYLPPAVAESLEAIFQSVVAYQPVAGRLPEAMRRLMQGGFLEILSPVTDDDPQVEQLAREFEHWGRLHHGGAGLHAAALFGRFGLDPLSQGEAPALLVSEIKRRCAPSAAPGPERSLMLARVFLHLTQQADFDSHQLQADLERIEKGQAKLFEALTGETNGSADGLGSSGTHGREAPRDRLLPQRIRAWARLFLHHPYPSPVFITASAETIELLAQRHPAMRRILPADMHPIPASAGLMSRLEILASGPAPVAASLLEEAESVPCEDVAAAAIYLLTGISPFRLFAGLAATAGGVSATFGATDRWRHTVIVQLS